MLSIVSQRLDIGIYGYVLEGNTSLLQKPLYVFDRISMARYDIYAPGVKGSTTSAMELLRIVDHFSMVIESHFWPRSGR